MKKEEKYNITYLVISVLIILVIILFTSFIDFIFIPNSADSSDLDKVLSEEGGEKDLQYEEFMNLLNKNFKTEQEQNEEQNIQQVECLT